MKIIFIFFKEIGTKRSRQDNEHEDEKRPASPPSSNRTLFERSRKQSRSVQSAFKSINSYSALKVFEIHFHEHLKYFLGRMTDVLRELNFNYANLEKDLNRYLARLNFDQSEEVTNFHASSQVRPFWGLFVL